MKITKFLFDLGNVFFDWDPLYVFKNIIPDQTKREYFMNTIAFPHLDMRCDAGVKIDDAVKDAIKNFPNYENEIKQYYQIIGIWLMGFIKIQLIFFEI